MRVKQSAIYIYIYVRFWWTNLHNYWYDGRGTLYHVRALGYRSVHFTMVSLVYQSSI